jgi:hypothetical protein
MNETVRDAVDGVIRAQEATMTNLPQHRRAEIKTHLEMSLDLVSHKLDVGYRIDVLIAPPETDETDDVADLEGIAAYEHINELTPRDGFRAGIGEPILRQLGSNDETVSEVPAANEEGADETESNPATKRRNPPKS